MFGIGVPEMLLILAIALIVIGPKKLPDLAKSLGRALREFKKATSELKESLEIDAELKDVKKSFSNIGSDIKGSLNGKSAAVDTIKDAQGPDPKVAALEESFDAWKGEQSTNSAAGDPQSPVMSSSEGERLAKPATAERRKDSEAGESEHNG